MWTKSKILVIGRPWRDPGVFFCALFLLNYTHFISLFNTINSFLLVFYCFFINNLLFFSVFFNSF